MRRTLGDKAASPGLGHRLSPGGTGAPDVSGSMVMTTICSLPMVWKRSSIRNVGGLVSDARTASRSCERLLITASRDTAIADSEPAMQIANTPMIKHTARNGRQVARV
ncbi:hypothetical protein [Barrientosiimonas humi]|nr:hypothetical protein [Barrientosiimonas humi]